jgi:hypothetical protein
MTDDREERIRQRAYAIWQREGQPDGSHQQHWDQAAAEIDLEAERVDRLAAELSEAGQATAAPQTSGAALETEAPLPDPFAPRRTKAPRQAGTTPRPTENPIAGAGNPSR